MHPVEERPERPAVPRCRRPESSTTQAGTSGRSVRGGHDWTAADLTARTGAPTTVDEPFGYTTNLTGQGPVARVLYVTANEHIEELSVM